MIVPFSAVSTVALALVGTSLATPLQPRDDKIIIGYRTVPKEQADAVRKHKTMVYFAPRGQQNGDGVYLTEVLGKWPATKDTDELCRFKADKDKVEKAKKAWIKKGDPADWNEEAVSKAIKELDDDLKPETTIRLSKIAGQDILQMVIPKKMLGHDLKLYHTKGDLDFEAECRPTKDWKKEDYVDINWKEGVFKENVEGDEQ